MVINLEQYMVFLLVMLRMVGMLLFHPILGRRNIPPMLGTGLAFVLAILLTGTITFDPLPELNLLQFLYLVVKELAVGLMAGTILRMFLSALIVGGEIIDMQNGLGMAKSFDPASNTSVSVTANLLNAFFILIFFATNNHLTFIHLSAQTFRIIPLGEAWISADALSYIPQLFSSAFLLAIKLCLPIVAVELVVTVAVGIIMRIIPQINIFVVNIQFKLFIGIFALIVLVVPIMGFFENLLIICMERVQEAWTYLLPV
ncbi:MAG: flagellar biosynthetic protein FliR [Oscillospiraceae bacterium]